MSQDFPQFAALPLELRRLIWSFAAAGWTQIIPLSLSDPKDAWEVSFASRKHIFASEMAVPPLLYACHDSRAAALEHYTLGLRMEGKTWGFPAHYFPDPAYRDCPHGVDLQECGRRTFWAPENDVVMLEHAEEPYQCDGNVICTSIVDRRYEYNFDDRIKFMAITKEVWNAGTGTILLDVPALEVLFVEVERKPCFPLLGSGGHHDTDALERRQKESCRIIEGQMTEAVRSDSALFRIKRERDVNIKVEVIVVESIDEIFDKVAKRRDLGLRSGSMASKDSKSLLCRFDSVSIAAAS